MHPHDLYKTIKRPHDPIPTFDKAILKHSAPKFFAKLDVHHGYWSHILDEDSSQLTMFNIPYGQYIFRPHAVWSNLSTGRIPEMHGGDI
ncbi:hypothetical protein QYM36_018875 [Artemia franciscana]|uniref:Reverse transcriptase domain-containing protein n=1 Tax=Artemia franciscana TaxID=6661 RepID=A0AA88H3A2_ARTSF|nr:hypothetical protein QYM36_018875 [Artemia franciscana]